MVSRKTILSIATFLLINLPLNTSYASSDIAALGDLKGIYVNLKINDRTPQGVPKQRVDKKKLLKHIEKQLINTIGKERGIRLFKSIDPHLNVNVIIEGQEHHAADRLKKYMYYVTVEANIDRNASEWYKEYTESWEENTSAISSARKRVNDAVARLKKVKKKSRSVTPGLSQSDYNFDKSWKNQSIFIAQSSLKTQKKILKDTIERYAISRAAEKSLSRIIRELTRDYRLARGLENEHKRKEKETEELLGQLGNEEETISLQQKDERYVESKTISRANVLYETGNTIKLRNPSDTVFALYKDESLSNIQILFTNGIKASIMDYKGLPDKPVVYKIQILLKDGSEYTGWISGDIISN